MTISHPLAALDTVNIDVQRLPVVLGNGVSIPLHQLNQY
jgi:hypothetical protein